MALRASAFLAVGASRFGNLLRFIRSTSRHISAPADRKSYNLSAATLTALLNWAKANKSVGGPDILSNNWRQSPISTLHFVKVTYGSNEKKAVRVCLGTWSTALRS